MKWSVTVSNAQHSNSSKAARRLSYDGAVIPASVGLPAKAGNGAGPTPALSEHPSAMVAIGRTLTAWRAAERELSGHSRANKERTRIRADVAVLRARYHQLFHERMARVDTPKSNGTHSDVYVWLDPELLRRN